MTCTDGDALFLFPHLLGADVELAYHADFFLALGGDGDNLALFELVFLGLGQPATFAGQARNHEGGARQDEADGAAVDLDGLEGMRVLVHDF